MTNFSKDFITAKFSKNDRVVVSAPSLKSNGEKGIVTNVSRNWRGLEYVSVKLDRGVNIKILAEKLEFDEKVIAPDAVPTLKELTEAIPTMGLTESLKGKLLETQELISQSEQRSLDRDADISENTNKLLQNVYERIDALEGKTRLYNHGDYDLEFIIETNEGFFNVVVTVDEEIVTVDDLLNDGEYVIDIEDVSEPQPYIQIVCMDIKTKEYVKVWLAPETFTLWPTNEFNDHLQELGLKKH